MICPYYKNSEVFNGFNEMIEALGGKPMTEEEFRNPELRNQRSGADYSAMEATYRIYNRNGGNMLDMTPQGKPSVLFQTLLNHFDGDRAKAIIAKSNVYSDEFFSWFGDWSFQSQDIDQQTKDQVSLIFKRIPQLSKIGTEEQYAQYIQTIFPNSQDKSIYWHGSDSDFSKGFKSAKRGEGSGAPETKERNDFYLAKQAWSVLQYVSGVNRKSVDKNGFSIWNKLWFEFKEIMANGRRENNDWKNIVINENTVRQAIPNKEGIFDRDQGKGHGKWLKERKADYGYENKSDKEFFEEILGVRWGVDTFNTWTQRNAEIFKSLQETESGIYPAVINTVNPIREKGQDTYYEEHRGLFTKADADGNDAILGSETDNEFGSDVAVVLRNNNNVHFLGTQEDMDAFSKFVNRQDVSKVVDDNGEPLVVWHGSPNQFDTFDNNIINKTGAIGFSTYSGDRGFYFTDDKQYANSFRRTGEYEQNPNYKNYVRLETKHELPKNGEVGRIYFVESSDKAYKWNGKRYVETDIHDQDYRNIFLKKIPVIGPVYPVYLNVRTDLTPNYHIIDEGLFKHYNEEDGEIDPEDDAASASIMNFNQETYRWGSNDSYILLHEGLVKKFIDMYGNSVHENNSGLIGKDFGIENPGQFEYVVFNPNQIKHVENLGTWNPNDPNIYKSTIDNTVDVDDSNIFKSTNLVDSFGNELATKLLNGETVSSKDLMNAMISNGVFHPGQFKLAELMSKHDVPVRISNNMGVGQLAETITDRGGSVILLNPKEVYNISRGYFGTTMIHELVHAVTVDIIDNPKTDEERAFVGQNRAVFQKLNTYFRKDGAIKFDALSGLHVLDNEKEFAAYFASDPNVRKNIFDLADAMDRGTKRGLFKRIQRLLNKFISAFISRSNIKEQSTREQVQEYEKALEDFLYDRPFIQKGNISSKSYLKAVYAEQNGAITNHENFIESMKLLEQMTTAQKNFVKLGNESYNIQIGKHKPGSVQITSWEEVKNSLSTRINALRGSNMDSVVKSRLLQITQNQLEMFAIDEAGKFLAVQNLLDTSIPQIIKDIENLKTIRRENGVFSNDDYMYHMHANLGMYNRVFDGIKKLIDDDHNRQEMVDAFNAKAIREEDKITVEDINEIERHLDNAKNFTEEGMNVVEYMLKENVIDKLKRIGNETGNPEMGDYINALNSTLASDMIDDIGQLESMAGSADSSTNEAVRTIAYMINKALTAATMNSAGKATDLLKLKENLKRGEHEWDIYETDEKGNFTGYLIRDLNFGRFYRDYQNEIRKINQDIRDIFDIPDLDLDHRTAPDIKKQVMINGVLMTPKEFFDNRKEDWLEEHAERRYKPEYYKQYSNLPQRVKDSLGEIRIQINAITQNYTDLYDDNGVPHYEKLSNEDWDKINVLWERRRSLRSDYDEYGNLTTLTDLKKIKNTTRLDG